MDYVRTYGGGFQSMGKKHLKEGIRAEKGWRIRTNKELQDQYRSSDTVTSIKVRRLEWAGHVVRMDDERMEKRVFLGNQGGRRKPGRPTLRWMDCVEDDLKTFGVKERKIVKNRLSF
jgi:hypothetical protein